MTDIKRALRLIENSELEIKAEITWDDFRKYRTESIKHLRDTAEIKGFRPGHAPEEILVKQLGEMKILEDAAKNAAADMYEQIIREEKIKAVGLPEIRITKLAADNPLCCKMITAVLPEINLPEYKKLSREIVGKKEKPREVADKEVTDAIDEIRRQIAHREHEHGLNDTKQDKPVPPPQKDLPLPELTDEFVKSLGNFKDVNDFKEKIRSGLAKEKETRAKDLIRHKISEKLISETKLTLPKILIDHELQNIEARFKSDIARMGLKIEDYLRHIKKTIDDIKKEWLPEAKKRASLQLIISAIADAEKIFPTDEEIKKETDLVMSEYKDANRERVENYVATVFMNEKVFVFLEGQK